MNPIYLYDSGVRPWEQTKMLSDSRFATVTVVHNSLSELSDLWLVLALTISKHLPRLLKWRTVGHSGSWSKVSELKLEKQLRTGLSDGDYIEKNNQSGVFSYVKKITEPMSEFDLNTITHSRYTSLLFVPEVEPIIRTIWETLSNSDKGLEAEGVKSLLIACKSLIICRLFESETHVSMQFIGEVKQVDVVLQKLSELKIHRAVERDVANLINDSRDRERKIH